MKKLIRKGIRILARKTFDLREITVIASHDFNIGWISLGLSHCSLGLSVMISCDTENVTFQILIGPVFFTAGIPVRE
jgi:hypothetical protein